MRKKEFLKIKDEELSQIINKFSLWSL